MMTLRRLLMVMFLIALPLGMAWGQDGLPVPPKVKPRPVPQPNDGLASYHERQLAQIDQLIRLGYNSRAYALLEQLAQMGAPEASVRLRRIRIALAVDDNERAEELCRAALADQPRDPSIWRQLAMALARQQREVEAREAITSFLSLVPEPKVGYATAVDLLREAGDHAGAVDLIDEARVHMGAPTFLARPRTICLLHLGRSTEAAQEAYTDLQASPYNLQLLRRDLLSDDAPTLDDQFVDELIRLAEAPDAQPVAAVLAANVALKQGDLSQALDLVLPRLEDVTTAEAALHNAASLSRELPLLASDEEQRTVTGYLLAILPVLGEDQRQTIRLRQRAFDQLAGVCGFALEHDLLDEDPTAAVARFGELLAMVQRYHPESAHLYASQIQLAQFTRQRLKDPEAAATQLEHLLLDLDLPLEGVALARLSLGESYLAAQDTVRARQVLTALGRDPDFRAPAGHAHFLLARLDLAEGHYGTSRDRLAAVALDNPAAPYANDALELGLVVAEELQNPTGGPDLLMRYSRAVWWELAAEPDSQRVALQKYLARAVVQVDLSEPQPLVERARWELATLERSSGRFDQALAQLERIVLDQPAGRMAARALAERGEILAMERLDPVAARREYERLLVQYPDYLFATEIRQRLKDLP